MSSMRIVLVNPLGEVLFSGLSLAAGSESAARSESEAPDEACPETLRSAGSGVFRAADPTAPSTGGELRRVG